MAAEDLHDDLEVGLSLAKRQCRQLSVDGRTVEPAALSEFRLQPGARGLAAQCIAAVGDVSHTTVAMAWPARAP